MTYPYRPSRRTFARRHYEQIAAALAAATSRKTAIQHMANMLAYDNVRFDRERFERAANRKGVRQ
jgi:hypothetical protein